MVISGKELSAKLKAEMAAEVATFGAKYGRVPHLVVILVGEDPGSVSYVTGKAKASAEVGIRNTTIRKPESVCEAELLGIIADLNADEGVDGILVQLPLPKHIDADKVIAAIDKEKDVDGFHPLNVAALWQKQPCTLPCTPKGILKMLRAAGVEIAGKEAVVIGRSNIVGLPVSKLLLDANATVTMAHSRTRNLGEVTRRADILVVAIGRPKFVTADMVRDGAVVIDVGVNRDPETGKLCGDVDFAAIEPKASVITPVPGGVGPMTICCLMEYDRVLPAAYRAEIAPNRLPRTLFASGALPRKTRSENFGFFSALPFPGLRRWGRAAVFLRPASSNACPAFCRVRAPLMSIFRMLVYRYAHGLYMKARIGIQKCFLCRLIRFIWCNDAVFI